MRKTTCFIIAMLMILAFANTAFAAGSGTLVNYTIGTSQNNSVVVTDEITISNGGTWGIGFSGDPTPVWSGTARLTVRPYAYNETRQEEMRLSNAKTFSSTQKTGSQTYDILAYPIYVKANSTTQGSYVSLRGTWRF